MLCAWGLRTCSLSKMKYARRRRSLRPRLPRMRRSASKQRGRRCAAMLPSACAKPRSMSSRSRRGCARPMTSRRALKPWPSDGSRLSLAFRTAGNDTTRHRRCGRPLCRGCRGVVRVGMAGRHLYPAFPYDHFTLLTDADAAALYAYLMSREPVAAAPPANELRFPFNLRPLLAGWKLLYLRKGPYEAVGGRGEAWNRGAYLVEGLAHCGACHTPRNALGAERKADSFGGGEAEG